MANIYGTDDSDTLVGGDNNDLVYGDDDNDILYGEGGDDTIYGDDGDDLVYGEGGDDFLYGAATGTETGADTLYGGTGDDTIYGRFGADSLYGEGGDDKLYGGGDDDSISGGDGDDSLIGDDGDDTLSGEGGDDTIGGGDGDDIVSGGFGDDNIGGNDGDDTLSGGQGDDTVGGGFGDDIVYGGAGNDTISEAALGGNNTLYGGKGDDSITSGEGDDLIYGDEGRDTIVAGEGENTIYGGDDDDSIYIVYGDNSLYGGEGDDTLRDGTGDDTIYGGEGDDEIYGSSGNDIFYGEGGDDYIIAISGGDDTVYGGEGDDTIQTYRGDTFLDGGSGNNLYTGITIQTGNDTIANFIDPAEESTGYLNNFDQYDNSFVDLSDIYDASALADVNAAGGNYASILALMRADQADGILDGYILEEHDSGFTVLTDYTSSIWHGGTSSLTILADDTNAVDASYLTYDTTNVCFASGTLINTLAGELPIETLKVGDKVLTLDHGYQPILWIGSSKVKAIGKQRPIRIMAGALGSNLPEKDLLVSRQHRILVSSKIAERMFGERQVLVAAIKLIELPGIFIDDSYEDVEYYHMLFDRHQIIFADGALAESLYTGSEALKAVSAEAREEILGLFPELKDGNHTSESACFIPNGKLQKKLIARHIKNSEPIILLKDFIQING